MARQKGIDLLLQKPDGSGGWTNVCGITTRGISINNNLITEEVLVDCQDTSAGVANIATYGAQNVSFTGSGIFEDDANGSLVADAAANRAVLTGYRVVVPGWGEFAGNWLVGDFTFDGQATGSLNFNTTISQAGPLTFTANT